MDSRKPFESTIDYQKRYKDDMCCSCECAKLSNEILTNIDQLKPGIEFAVNANVVNKGFHLDIGYNLT
jgi:hypothetical protein